MYDTFEDILKKIDEKKGPLEVKSLELINRNAAKLILTMAEKILIYEGSQTGIADCTIAPFVQFERENDFKVEDVYIRSELLEWMLDSYVSKSIIKAGYLKIIGATILSSSDFVINNVKDDSFRDNRYSLDIGSQDVYIDLTFSKCVFNSGINISNSYTENIIFEDSKIGKTYNAENSKDGISINAENANINGDLRIMTTSNIFSSFNEAIALISGDINLEFCKISGTFTVENKGKTISGRLDKNIRAGNAHFESFVLKNVTLLGFLSLKMSIVLQTTEITSSTIKGRIDCWNFKSDSLLMTDCRSEGRVNLIFAEINKLFLEHSLFLGYPHSFDAGGLKAYFILMRHSRTFFGASFLKCFITSEVQFHGSFFGPSHASDTLGLALSLRGSSFVSGSFTDDFCSVGLLDLSNVNVSGSLDFQKGKFLSQGINKTGASISRFAIYGSNISVAHKINFNNAKIFNSSPESEYSVDTLKDFLIYSLRVIVLKSLDDADQPSVHFVEKMKHAGTFQRKTIAKNIEILNEYIELYLKDKKHVKILAFFENEILIYLNRIVDRLQTLYSEHINKEDELRLNDLNKNIQNAKDVTRFFSLNYNAVDQLLSDAYLKNIPELVNVKNYAIVFGEAYFQELTLQGQMDCAGGLFYRTNIGVNMPNALTIRHSRINGTLYLNKGFKDLLLPMICKGEVNLQYSRIAQLSISTAIAIDRVNGKKNLFQHLRLYRKNNHKYTRWNLIGTRYEYITSDAQANGNDILMKCDWIYKDRLNENFKQPYEQLSSTLFSSGSDIHARKILIYKVPSSNWAERYLVMGPIRRVASLTFPAYKSLVWIVILVGAGTFFFNQAALHQQVVAVSIHAIVKPGNVESRARPVNKINPFPIMPILSTSLKPSEMHPPAKSTLVTPLTSTPSATSTNALIEFNPFWFSVERLIPLIESDQKELFKVKPSAGFYYAYYRFHSIFGAICVAIFFLGISRIRRNS